MIFKKLPKCMNSAETHADDVIDASRDIIIFQQINTEGPLYHTVTPASNIKKELACHSVTECSIFTVTIETTPKS